MSTLLLEKLHSPHLLDSQYTDEVLEQVGTLVDISQLTSILGTGPDGPIKSINSNTANSRRKNINSSSTQSKKFSNLKQHSPQLCQLLKDIVVRITKLFIQDYSKLVANKLLSSVNVQTLVDVARLGLNTLYQLEGFLVLEPLSLELTASNLIIGLVQIKKFREALSELKTIHRRINIFIEDRSGMPPNKKFKGGKALNPQASSTPTEGSSVDVPEPLYNLLVGFKLDPFLFQVSDVQPTLLRLIAGIQVNVLRCYIELGDIASLKTVAQLPTHAPGSPLYMAKELFVKFCSAHSNVNFFYELYCVAANKLVVKADAFEPAINLFKTAVEFFILCPKFSFSESGDRIRLFVRSCKTIQSDSPRFQPTIIKLYEELFEILAPGQPLSKDAILPYNHIIIQYFELVVASQSDGLEKAYNKAQEFFGLITQNNPQFLNEKICGDWLHSIGLAGSLCSTPQKNIHNEQIWGIVTADIVTSTKKLSLLLHGRSPSEEFLEHIANNLRILIKSWGFCLNLKSTGNIYLDQNKELIFEAFYSILNELIGLVCKPQAIFKPDAPSSVANRLQSITDLIMVLSEPMLDIVPNQLLGMFQSLNAFLIQVPITEEQQKFSKTSFFCGSYLEKQTKYKEAIFFFELACLSQRKILETTHSRGDSMVIKAQLSKKYFKMANCLRSDNRLLEANRAIVEAINCSPNIEVGVMLEPDSVSMDNEQERLYYVDRYVKWNLIATQKSSTYTYPLLKTFPELSLEGTLSNAALTEKELCVLNDNPLRSTFDARLDLVDYLLSLYSPVHLHRLTHARALLLKFNLLLANMIFNRVNIVLRPGYQISEEGFDRSQDSESKIVLKRLVMKAKQLLLPTENGHTENLSSRQYQLISQTYFALGWIAHEFHDDYEQHFDISMRYWTSAFQECESFNLNQIGTVLKSQNSIAFPEGVFQISKKMLNIFRLLSLHHLVRPLYDVMLKICPLRKFPDVVADVVTIYMDIASMHQQEGEHDKASHIFRQSSSLLEKFPKLMLPGLTMRLHLSKHMLETGSDDKRKTILEKLSKLSTKVSQLEPKIRDVALASAYEHFSLHYLYDGDIHSSIDLMQHYRVLSLKAINTVLIQDGFHRDGLNSLSTILFWECLCVSSHYDLKVDILYFLKVLGQLYVSIGSSREAERMFKLGLHLSKSAGALGHVQEFQLLEGDLSCRRHNWKKCSLFVSTVLTSLSSAPKESENLTKNIVSALVFKGKMLMGQKNFARAHDSFLQAAYKLENVTSSSFSELESAEDTSFSLAMIPFISQKKNKFWNLQIQLICLLSWTLVKLNRLDEARQLISQVDGTIIPKALQHQYHLMLSKLSVFNIVKLLSKHDRFSTILDSVWSIPGASRSILSESSSHSKFLDASDLDQLSENLKNAETHLNLALKDVFKFGMASDALEIGNYFGFISNLQHFFGSKTNIIPPSTSGLAHWIAYSLDSPKGLSYRRENLGLLTAKTGNSILVDKWPQYPPRKKIKKQAICLWSRILEGYEAGSSLSPEKSISYVIDLLPPNWAVCSLSYNPETEEIYVSRLQTDLDFPILLRLPTCRHSPPDANPDDDEEKDFSFSLAHEQLKTIIETNVIITNKGAECDTIEKKEKWWRTRYALDLQLQNLLEYMENAWLGGLKGILATDEFIFSDELINEFHDSLITILTKHLPSQFSRFAFDKSLLKIALKAGSRITLQNIEDWLLFLLDSLELANVTWSVETFDLEGASKEVFKAWHQLLARTQKIDPAFAENGINHVILILDKHTQFFPWENLPLLRGSSVSRLPSIHCLRDCLIRLKHDSTKKTSLFRSLFETKGHVVDQDQAFYVLNPEKDLISTQNRLQDNLIKYSRWSGVIGHPPNNIQLESALSEKDLYLYFGHGSGSKYLSSDQLKKLRNCSVALLFGCSSGALLPDGDFDPTGEVMNYLMAGCPTVLANLWDVTDKDLDRFTVKVFESWGLKAFSSPDQDDLDNISLSLTQVVADSRSACKLRYLVGAAPVVYGIPCYIKKTNC